MTTSRKAAGAAMTAMMLVLAGCGSKSAGTDGNTTTITTTTTTTAPAAASLDPCSVLTADEVAAVTTEKVTSTNAIDHDCHYLTAMDQDDGTILSIYRTGGKDQMEVIRKANQLLGGIGGAVAGQGDVGKDVQRAITPPAEGGAPAIGDEAVWSPNDVLAVRKGDALVQVTPPLALDPKTHPGHMIVSDADKKAIVEKLAAAVLAKLAA